MTAVCQPLLQVDRFAWPDGCQRFWAAAASELEDLADGVSAGISLGQKVIAVCGCRQGNGCTTLLLCAAERLASRGLKVVAVDADFEQPLLGRRLGLLPEIGWQDVLCGLLPLEEALIESIEERLTVLPLQGQASGGVEPENCDAAKDICALRNHYDVVLVDLGRFSPAGGLAGRVLNGAGQWIDRAVVVRDVRDSTDSEVDRVSTRLRKAGIAEAGVVDNFA